MKDWEKLVVLHPFGDRNASIEIGDAKSAARALIKAWPERDGKSYRRAVLTCAAAVHEKVPQETAQWAFIVATMEAGICYEIVDRLDSEIAAVCREMFEEEMHTMPPGATAEGDLTMPPFWWPKPRTSAPSAR